MEYYKSKNTGNIYKFTDDGRMTVMYLDEDYSGDYEVGGIYKQESIVKEPLSFKEDWLLLLPDGYRERALAARKSYKKEYLTAPYATNNTSENLHDALWNGFAFHAAKEGYDFWDQVKGAARTMDFSQLPALPESPTTETKQMKQLPKNWYIKTLSPGVCREIQEELFKLGYKWNRHGKTVSYTEDVILLFNKTQEVIDGFVSLERFKTSHYNTDHVEISIEDLFNAEPLPPKIEKKVFKLGGIAHDVVVEGENITVGCQNTTVTDLKNLVEVFNKRVDAFNDQSVFEILEEDYAPALDVDKKNVKVKFGGSFHCTLEELEKLLSQIKGD